MFAGRKRRSSNVKVMQLFHELKQQFPTVPDHIVTSCITSYVQAKAQGKSYNIAEYIESALAENNIDPMGRPSQQLESPLLPTNPSPDPEDASAEQENQTFTSATVKPTLVERSSIEMTESASNSNRKSTHSSVPYSKPNELKTVAKRPDHLDIKSENVGNFESSIENKRNFNIQLSEKCKDIHKLLNSNISDKPPRSPLGAKRLAKNSPTKLDKYPLLPPDSQKQLQEESTRELTKLPDYIKISNVNKSDNTKKESSCPSSQQTNVKDEISKTSLGAIKKELCSTPTQTTDTLISAPNVNLSLNVNLDVLQSPTPPRRTSILSVTPSQPWLQTPTSPRSFTSVNLTLRSPSSTPQDPIDITSHNAGMTYSTSNFDAEKGLGSRLQITVGPGGSGSVQAVRLRPRSFHQQESDQEVVPARAGSLNNLAMNSEPPLLLKQKARLERLRTELNNGKARYAALKKEVEELEKKRLESNHRVDREIERQLEMEIKHLRNQCGKLEIDDNDFYSNIYEGQRLRQRNRRRLPYPAPSPTARIPPDIEGPKWNCGLCTFLNHPDLDKCEQCEMPRIVHGTKPTEAFNPNITLHTQHNPNIIDRSFSLRNIPSNSLNITRPIGFVLDHNEQGMSIPSHITSSRSAPNILK